MREWSEAEIEARAREVVARASRPRRRDRLRVAETLRSAPLTRVPLEDGDVAAWRLGAGPAVMLVHGWEDDNALWTPLISQLSALGSPLIAVDLPGHGHSTSNLMGVEQAAVSLLRVADALGPVDAIIGHSFGVSAALRALQLGLGAGAAVMIAPPLPTRPDLMKPRKRPAPRHSEAEEDIPPALEARIKELFAARDRIGGSPFRFDPETAAADMNARALFVHCRDDEMWRHEASERIASRWRGAELHLTTALGHRAVARDPDVIKRIIAFLEEARR